MSKSEVKNTRQQIMDLQVLMQEEVKTAMNEMRDILNRPEFVQAITDIRALRENVSPGSSEEQQIDTFVNLHTGVLSVINQKYPVQTPPVGHPVP